MEHARQALPATRQRAEIRHWPVQPGQFQPGQFQQACNQPRRLPQRQAEPARGFARSGLKTVRRPVFRAPFTLQRQASLNGSVGGRWPNGPACHPVPPARPSPGQTRCAAPHAASGRRCRSASSSCGRSGEWVCSCPATNTMESRRESLAICATEPVMDMRVKYLFDAAISRAGFAKPQLRIICA